MGKIISKNYRSAGVDIKKAEKLIKIIAPIAKSTKTKGSDASLGGFGGVFDLSKTKFKKPLLIASTDGVGTKLKVANIFGEHKNIGIDLVAMCVNDIIVHGAKPLFFLDYFATNELEINKMKQIISGIAAGCRNAGCTLIGGETAEMPGMYKNNEYDLSGFSVGAVERNNLLNGNKVKNGDILIGLKSNGIHSNGFSLIRKLMKQKKINLFKRAPFKKNEVLGKMLLKPTKIYVKTCLSLIAKGYIKSMAHITGGGLVQNIPRTIPSKFGAKIDCQQWKLPAIFKWISDVGKIPLNEMMTVFNCGIGMVITIHPDNIKNVMKILKKNKQNAIRIGEITNQRKGTSRIQFVNVGAWKN